MQLITLWAVSSSLLCAGSALASVPLSSVKKGTNLPFVPNQFIVEVDTAANIPTKRSLTVRFDNEMAFTGF